MQIGVFGGHDVASFESCRGIACQLGQLIGQGGHFLITGGSTGVSKWAAEGARSVGGFVVGICPELQRDSEDPTVSLAELNIVIRTGMTYKLRNVISVLSSDVCIFIGGAFGTLNEFTIAVDHSRPCVVVHGTGGMTQVISDILRNLPQKTSSIVQFATTADEAYRKAISLVR